MKKLLFISALLLATIVAPAQLSRNYIVKTFTFTASTNSTSYTQYNLVNQYTTSKTIYSVDIGVPYTSLVGIDIATTHTGTPKLDVQLFTATVTMPGDNAGTMTLTPTELTNSWLAAVPMSSVTSMTGAGSTTANTYSASSIPANAAFSSNKLYFVIRNTASGGTPSPSAQYHIRFTLRKD